MYIYISNIHFWQSYTLNMNITHIRMYNIPSPHQVHFWFSCQFQSSTPLSREQPHSDFCLNKLPGTYHYLGTPGNVLTYFKRERQSKFKVEVNVLYYFSIYQESHKALYIYICIRSDQISRSVVSDSLWPHESQHARPPCPSPTPGVHSNSCPSSRWCHPAVSSSVVPFSSCPYAKKQKTYTYICMYIYIYIYI